MSTFSTANTCTPPVTNKVIRTRNYTN